MLLGAAKAMAERRRFDGTVYFIFQPAEENEGGGRVMVEEGLFDRFPMESVYGLHNWPLRSLGTFATRVGPLMGAYDIFEIVATGKGAHAALPYLAKDPMLFAAHLVNALQTIVARNLHPQDAGVVSVTQIHGGETWNIIPEQVVIRGTVRTFRREVQDLIESRLRAIVAGVAATFDMGATRALRAPLSRDGEHGRGDRPCGARDARRRRRGAGRHRSGARDGQRGLRVHARGEARLLCLDGHGRRRGDGPRAQPALRLQRRGAADRRVVLGDAGGAAAAGAREASCEARRRTLVPESRAR